MNNNFPKILLKEFISHIDTLLSITFHPNWCGIIHCQTLYAICHYWWPRVVGCGYQVLNTILQFVRLSKLIMVFLSVNNMHFSACKYVSKNEAVFKIWECFVWSLALIILKFEFFFLSNISCCTYFLSCAKEPFSDMLKPFISYTVYFSLSCLVLS